MINVKLLYRRPDGATAEGVPITTGEVAIQSVRRYDTTNGEMTPAAFKVPIGSTVALDAGTWRFILIAVPDGLGGFFTGTDAVSVRSVPVSVPTAEIPAGKVNGDGSVDVDDLPETTVDNSPISSSPEWKAYVDAAIASVSAGAPSGGPFVAVADTTTLSRSLLAAGTQAAARTTIDAAPTTHTHAVPGGLAATGTPSSSTFLNGAGQWAVPPGTGGSGITGAPSTWPSTFPPAAHTQDISTINGLQALLDTTPYTLNTVGGVYPPRPATTRSVWFMDPAVQPANDGALAGGGGMYPQLDVWLSG